MSKKSETSTIVRKQAVDITPASDAKLARLHAAMKEPIDTSDIPEQSARLHRLRRDATGRLPTRKSMIRDAIVIELKNRNMTPYRLWKEAKTYCPTLSQSAVHEFIKGQRELELPYAEALMAAMHLGIARDPSSTRRRRAISSSSGLKAVAKRSVTRGDE